jgi:hypothetical protein
MKLLTGFLVSVLAFSFLTQCSGGHEDRFRDASLERNCFDLRNLGYRIYCQVAITSDFYLSNNGLLPTAKYFLVDDTTMNTFFAANQLTEDSFKNSAPKVNAFINAHSAISDLTTITLKLNSGRTVNISSTPANFTIDGLKATTVVVTNEILGEVTDGRLLKLQGILSVTLP